MANSSSSMDGAATTTASSIHSQAKAGLRSTAGLQGMRGRGCGGFRYENLNTNTKYEKRTAGNSGLSLKCPRSYDLNLSYNKQYVVVNISPRCELRAHICVQQGLKATLGMISRSTTPLIFAALFKPLCCRSFSVGIRSTAIGFPPPTPGFPTRFLSSTGPGTPSVDAMVKKRPWARKKEERHMVPCEESEFHSRTTIFTGLPL